MDKVLFVATIDQHIRHFHYPFLQWFKDNGYEVHVASNGDEKLLYVDKKFNVPFERSPFKLNNLKSYKLLRNIIEKNEYKLIHCHTPVGGAIGRLASISARRKGLRVIYTAHGFHFYTGAPRKNWFLYYPVEKMLARFTDVLITINMEDYTVATNNRFKATKIEYINGVGVDLERFTPQSLEIKRELRKRYAFSDEDFILIYVGELSYRKHQDLLIQAVSTARKDIPNLKLLLVGEGELYEFYDNLIRTLEVEENVDLLGYRKDVADLLMLSDLAVSSSRQEGLPVFVMEAMATGLPLLVSNTRGNRDLVDDGRNGFVFELGDVTRLAHLIIRLYNDKDLRLRCGMQSLSKINEYSVDNILARMKNVYFDVLK